MIKSLLRNTTENENGCLLWNGYKDRSGYGRMNRKDYDTTYVHRAVFIEASGGKAEGKVVCHKCDTPSCINPEHLFVGTQKDNVQDMLNKKRDAHFGERSHRAKLTDDQVMEIKESKETGAILASKYGITRQYANQIKACSREGFRC